MATHIFELAKQVAAAWLATEHVSSLAIAYRTITAKCYLHMSMILKLLRDSIAFVALFVRVATVAVRGADDVISFALAYEHPANRNIPSLLQIPLSVFSCCT
jgi:hypothetical protein